MISALRPHIVPFISLLVLLALTAIGSAIPLGAGNLILALTISVAKMLIVAAFFMELRKNDVLIRLAACVGLLWLTLFLMLVLTDYLTRWPGLLQS